ncbi:uncharacterized protein LOC123561354 [Mercenaria mercenaria]|uniref:uncharacterized protein LOC123561354 n=1 Tax=Mercenaria mercenaria TaxID=6596 RepID=UPI00234EF937|nr:uncharacterized protein LOC123561354 [Mercenaria mercenaria]
MLKCAVVFIVLFNIPDTNGQWKGPIHEIDDGVVECEFGSYGPCILRFPMLGVPCFPGYSCKLLPGKTVGKCCKRDAHECPIGQDGVCGIVGDVGVSCKPGTICIKSKCCIETCPNGQNGTCNKMKGPECGDGSTCIFGDTPDAIGKCCINQSD